MVSCPTCRLLSNLSAWVERLDTTERFLENTICLLDQRFDVLDESFLIQFVLLLVSFSTGKVLLRRAVSIIVPNRLIRPLILTDERVLAEWRQQ